MAKKPNILLITTDQQRYDTVAPDRPSFLRTPHYDHLSREGITFSRAYSDCPICVPTRISIMTGKYALTHGMLNNGETSEVMSDKDTLPEILRRCGYQTAAIGKMHFGPERVRHGFEEMILPADYYNEMAKSGNPLQPMHHGLGQNELYPTMATVPEALTLTSWTAEKCIEYIQKRRDPSKPFFLWCSFSKPHPPFDPPEPYYSMYRGKDIPDSVVGEWADDENCPEDFKRFRQRGSYDLIPEDVLKEARAAYWGLITQIDYNMGRVFAGLQDNGEFEETLIIYTSDHGEFLGDHNTGCKIFPHEPSAHVPFVLRLPKSWTNRMHGQSIDKLITHADILKTLVEAAGGEVNIPNDGINLIELARGQAEGRECIVIAAENKNETDNESYLRFLSVFEGRWKYIYYTEGAQEQLFDLENDPKELVNLAAGDGYSDKIKELRGMLIGQKQVKKYLVNGNLPTRAIQTEDHNDRRNNYWAGYHTEFYGVDVKH